MTDLANPSPPPAIIPRPDREGATIAYHAMPGKRPGVVFLTGFKSDMTGGKATRLAEFCRDRGQAYVRFDYFGHGASSGAFADGTIGRWADDAVFVLDRLTEGPQVLVGSSMGGWVMLLAALRRPERVSGLVGIAAAPDFTEDLVWDAFTPARREAMRLAGYVDLPDEYGGEPHRYTLGLVEEGRNHLLMRAPIDIRCPVRLIHGMSDPDVPWRTALALSDRLVSGDVEVTLVKAGNHRLSEPGDLDRMCRVVEALLRHLEA